MTTQIQDKGALVFGIIVLIIGCIIFLIERNDYNHPILSQLSVFSSLLCIITGILFIIISILGY